MLQVHGCFSKVPAPDSGGQILNAAIAMSNSRMVIRLAYPAMFHGDGQDRNRRIVEIIIHLQAIVSLFSAATRLLQWMKIDMHILGVSIYRAE